MSLPLPIWTTDRPFGLVAKAIVLTIALLFALAPRSSFADTPLLSVIYPQADGAYKKLFDDIVAGIAAEAGVENIARLPLSNDADVETLIDHLSHRNPDAVIVLGRHPYQLVSALDLSKPLIVGALNITPDAYPNSTGVSLIPNPKPVFLRLRELAPNVNRVVIVFDPDKERWLAELAKREAPSFGLIVDFYAARDLAEASRQYLNIIRYGNPKSDAIWITSNPALVNENTWPRLVEQSWQRKVLLFSNSLAYADTGALFAVYPEPSGLGRRLAQLAAQRIADPSLPPRIEPLQNVNAALNVRVADHLGIWLDDDDKRSFDLILGERQ